MMRATGARRSVAAKPVTEENSVNQRKDRGSLLGVAVYVGVALVGYLAGATEPFSASTGAVGSTPLARVGFALREPNIRASRAAWASLSNDVEAVRNDWKSPNRDIFDLVVAVRGLQNAGESDWAKAASVCESLEWPRCDRPALEELKQRSRP